MKTERAFIKSPDSLVSHGLAFYAGAMIVDNPTNQWLWEPDSNRFIPPFFGGVVISLTGIQVVSLENRAPIGITQPPAIAGQVSSVKFSEADFPDSPGLPLITPRPNYYDRNPIALLPSYAANGLGTHAFTTRWSYSVPPAREAFVEAFFGQMRRNSAAGTVAYAEIYAVISGGGNPDAPIAGAHFGAESLNANTPGAGIIVSHPLSVQLSAGGIIYGATINTDTGGGIDFNVTVKIVEFDAA